MRKAKATLPPIFLAFGLLAFVACKEEKPPPPEPTPTPLPTPVPTPHPAKGAQEAAKRLYPDLAVQDSLFHTTFMEVFAEWQQRRPRDLAEVDWPLKVARRAAEILNVEPAAATPVATPKAANTPSPLERGPYNQTRTRAIPYSTQPGVVP